MRRVWAELRGVPKAASAPASPICSTCCSPGSGWDSRPCRNRLPPFTLTWPGWRAAGDCTGAGRMWRAPASRHWRESLRLRFRAEMAARRHCHPLPRRLRPSCPNRTRTSVTRRRPVAWAQQSNVSDTRPTSAAWSRLLPPPLPPPRCCAIVVQQCMCDRIAQACMQPPQSHMKEVAQATTMTMMPRLCLPPPPSIAAARTIMMPRHLTMVATFAARVTATCPCCSRSTVVVAAVVERAAAGSTSRALDRPRRRDRPARIAAAEPAHPGAPILLHPLPNPRGKPAHCRLWRSCAMQANDSRLPHADRQTRPRLRIFSLPVHDAIH